MFVRRFRKAKCRNIINDHNSGMMKLRKVCWTVHMECMEEEKGYRNFVGKRK